MGKSGDWVNNDETVEDKLLHLIEQEDPTVILSTEYLESFNELMKLELVTIENEKLKLTEKGRQAKINGVKAALETTKPIEEQVKLSDFPVQKLKQGVFNRAFLYMLFFFLISVLVISSFLYTPSV